MMMMLLAWCCFYVEARLMAPQKEVAHRSLRTIVNCEDRNGVITRQVAHNLAKAAKAKKREDSGRKSVATACEVQMILTKALERADQWWPQSLVRLDVPAAVNGKIVVVGDIHGQLQDFLWLFDKHGYPSKDTVYLFNGDINNRGEDAVDIWAILLAFKLWDSNCVHFNRGNHESWGMLRQFKDGGGLLSEIEVKFRGEHTQGIVDRFLDFFDTLPLYTVVADKIFVVHGGPPQSRLGRNAVPTLDQLANINHKRDIPHKSTRDEASIIFRNCIWGDASTDAVETDFLRRGRGARRKYGPSTSNAFLQANNLEVIFRGHKPKGSLGRSQRWPGIESYHDSKVLTLFPASNYKNSYRNFGAVALITKGDKNPMVHYAQHYIQSWSAYCMNKNGNHHRREKMYGKRYTDSIVPPTLS
eukprot:GEMP01043986.1.p1 GENE.GEMP01043986.1~~GEMP01043986.1.p1  ORF type:complete len:415 (+),score=55.61 GEMP01043986.1:87-1331(+)